MTRVIVDIDKARPRPTISVTEQETKHLINSSEHLALSSTTRQLSIGNGCLYQGSPLYRGVYHI